MTRSKTDLAREQVASEARHWVRVSRTCNNRCVFCLDSDVQDGTVFSRSDVERDIDRGIEQGATRLILSGGEATIHPDFVHFVQYGKNKGYGHVQTITNGRMFAYQKFTRAAIEAGLGEVTFSMHGHTPELQDELTGVDGSFAQTVAGIRNVVASGIVVSGDVVISKRNVRHLREILDLFIELGVREFDILMAVPFGRASPKEDEDILFDLEDEIVHVRKAFDLSRDPTLHVWTNRMDPMFLEGYEDLIQDPHKLHDEVRGRNDILEDLVRGRPMRCAGDRCSHCFIRHLCARMQEAVVQVSQGVPGVLRVDLTMEPDERVLSRLNRERQVLWLRARDASRLGDLDRFGKARAVWLSLEDLGGALDAVPSASRIIVRRGDQIEEALGMGVGEVMVVVNRSTAPFLQRHEGTILAYRPAGSLREAVERDVDLARSLEGVNAIMWVDIPPCLSGAGAVIYEDPIDLAVIGGDGLIDPDAFVSHFIRWHYRTRSLRCRACRHSAACRGISINLARHAGLGILEPVE